MGLMNLLVFLKQGKHRHLSERLTGLVIVPKDPSLGRSLEGVIHYDNLSRQLVWSKLSEFSVFLLSLVNWRYLQNRVSAWVSHLANRSITNDTNSDMNLKACSSCHAAPATMPYVTNCSHVYCYHCIQTLCSVSKPSCPRCGESIVTSSRVSGA